MAVSSEVVLTESQIFTQRKTNFKNKKHTILTMIIFYPSHVFTSHFVAKCKSFMKPKLGYFYEYNILYAKPTLRRLFFRKKWTKYKQVLYHSDALCLDLQILLSSCAKFVLNPQHRRAKLTNFPSHQTPAQQWGILRNFWLHFDGGIYDFADPAWSCCVTRCHFTFLPRCWRRQFCWNNIAVRFTEAPALSICGKLI